MIDCIQLYKNSDVRKFKIMKYLEFPALLLRAFAYTRNYRHCQKRKVDKTFCVHCDSKELFATTLNRITCSWSVCTFYAWCSTLWVERLVTRRANKRNGVKQRNSWSDPVHEVKNRHSSSVASLQYTRVNKSIIGLYTTHDPKALINMLSHSKSAQNTTKMRVTNIREKSSGLYQ